MNWFTILSRVPAIVRKFPAAKPFVMQIVQGIIGLYSLFKPEVDEFAPMFMKAFVAGKPVDQAAEHAAEHVVKMHEGAWSREEEEAANRRMD